MDTETFTVTALHLYNCFRPFLSSLLLLLPPSSTTIYLKGRNFLREEIFAEEIFAEFIFAILPFFAKLNSEKNEENSFNRKNKFRKICKLQRAEKNKFLFSERLFFRNNYRSKKMKILRTILKK